MESEFNALLDDLAYAYDKSDIKKYCEKNDHDWNYSLVTSTLEKEGPLVVGFNWGAAKKDRYKPQSFVEKSNFETVDVGSISRIYSYCRMYFGNEFLSKVSQTNYCFFRSHKESEISVRDVNLCEPIFDKLVELIEPSVVLCLSSKLRDYLLSSGRLGSIQSKDIKFMHGDSERTLTTIKAEFPSGANICFLPHPNYPLHKHVRDAAWEFCCG